MKRSMLLVAGSLTLTLGSLAQTVQAKEGTDVDDFAAFYAPAYVLPSLDEDDMPPAALRGKELVHSTWKFLGNKLAENGQPYVGGKLACTSCHFNDGTRPNGAPFVVAEQKYGFDPATAPYSSRTNENRTLPIRINGCMQRSMAGEPLPESSQEMQDFLAYFNYLSTGLQDGYTHKDVPGLTFIKKEWTRINRQADIFNGELLYNEHCYRCHSDDAPGQGKWDGSKERFRYPALWGNDAFGAGAGVGRIETTVRLIWSNMPYDEVDALDPSTRLSKDDAWDIAGYINSKPHIWKDRYENDWSGIGPDGMPIWMKRKPASGGPMTDGSEMRPLMPRDCGDGVPVGDTSCPPMFSQEQHNLGPHQPIQDKLSEAKATWLMQNE